MAPGTLSNLYHCPVDGRTVLFDVAGDRYLLVPEPLQHAFDDWLADETVPAPDFLKPLLAIGRTATSPVRPLRAAPVSAATRTLERDGSQLSLARLLGAWRWKRTTAQVRYGLAGSGLAAMLERVRTEKRSIADPHDPGPLARQLRAAQEYRAITGDCLVQSLAMMRALHRQHSTATLVFGVTLDPFRAHSWVQHADCVLNDEADAVAPYRPILTL
jgi:hypothetical protein